MERTPLPTTDSRMAEYSIRSRQVPIKRKSSSSSSGSSGSGSGSDSGSGSSSSGDSNPNSNPNSKPLLSRKPPQYPAQSNTSFSLLDIVRLLGGLFLLSSTLSYFVTSNSIFWNYGPSFAAQSGRLTAWLVCFPRSPPPPLIHAHLVF